MLKKLLNHKMNNKITFYSRKNFNSLFNNIKKQKLILKINLKISTSYDQIITDKRGVLAKNINKIKKFEKKSLIQKEFLQI